MADFDRADAFVRRRLTEHASVLSKINTRCVRCLIMGGRARSLFHRCHTTQCVVTQFGRRCVCTRSVTFNLPRDHVDLADVFAEMEVAQHDGVVQFWEITQTSLEEVFIRVVEQDEASGEID